jgi:hypothetical protein
MDEMIDNFIKNKDIIIVNIFETYTNLSNMNKKKIITKFLEYNNSIIHHIYNYFIEPECDMRELLGLRLIRERQLYRKKCIYYTLINRDWKLFEYIINKYDFLNEDIVRERSQLIDMNLYYDIFRMNGYTRFVYDVITILYKIVNVKNDVIEQVINCISFPKIEDVVEFNNVVKFLLCMAIEYDYEHIVKYIHLTQPSLSLDKFIIYIIRKNRMNMLRVIIDDINLDIFTKLCENYSNELYQILLDSNTITSQLRKISEGNIWNRHLLKIIIKYFC